MIFYRHINTTLLACFISVLFGYLTRIFPEKIGLLWLIRLSTLAVLSAFWKYDDENRSLYTFLLIGLNLGMGIAYWDEVILLSTAYPQTTLLLIFGICLVVSGFICYAIKTKSHTKES